MDKSIIEVESLSKSYLISHQGDKRNATRGYRRLSEELIDIPRKVYSRFRSVASRGRNEEEFRAISDVSFKITDGEVVGIIGRNGAGKSTLLKILSRITEPSAGRVTLRGRVASLLEVGTGFHPELTGRENVFLNGAILGMNRVEIKKKFDAIVDFADVEKFLDTPVKRYSSGMYVRLAFAVAAHLDPEILVVDEVLAVGDAEFQKKCIGKMKEVGRTGRTVLFVSHNLQTVRSLCTRAILFESGKLAMDGECSQTLNTYLSRSESSESRDSELIGQKSGVVSVGLVDLQGRQIEQVFMGDDLRIKIALHLTVPVSRPQYGCFVHRADGTPILDLRTRHSCVYQGAVDGRIDIVATVAANGLYPGEYLLSPWVTDESDTLIEWAQYRAKFAVLPQQGPLGDLRLSADSGAYFVPSTWSVS